LITFTTGLFVEGFIGITAMSAMLLSSQDKYIPMKIKGECQCNGSCKQQNGTVRTN